MISSEYVLQESESNLKEVGLIFEQFEQKFVRFSQVKIYFPIFELMLKEGLDFLNKDGYSGLEIRLISGARPMLKADFTVMSREERVDAIISIVENWKLKNPGVGNNYFFNLLILLLTEIND